MVDSVAHAPKLSPYRFRVGTKRIGSNDTLWEVVKTKKRSYQKMGENTISESGDI